MLSIDYEVEYNNRARVPEHPAIFARWEKDAAAYRERDLGKPAAPSLACPTARASGRFIDLFKPAR